MTAAGQQGFEIGSGQDAVLLVHGLGSTPAEMRPVAERLASSGLRAVALLLPGHGTSPEDLERTSWTEWYAAVEHAVSTLGVSSRRVFGVGLSTGGALLLRFAALHPHGLAALATLSTPFRLDGLARLYSFAHGTRLDRAIRFWPKPLRDIRDREARRSYPCYSRLPLRSVGELRALLDDLRPRLGAVRTPLLVVHSRRDHTVSSRNAERLLAAVSSPVREKLLLTRSFHVVSVDVERDVVADAVSRFFEPWREPRGATLPR